MNHNLKRVSILLVVCLLGAGSADARQGKPAARSRAGSPSVDLPRYSSIEAFLASRRSPSTLRSSGTGVPTPAALPGSTVKLPTTRATRRAAAVEVIRAANGTISWLRGDLGSIDVSAGKAAVLATVAADASRQLNRWRSVLLLEHPEDELEGTRMETDDLGMTHVRFRQTLDGIPVWARELIVHADRSGRIVSVNGSYEPTAARPRNRIAFDEREAWRRVERILMAEGRWNPPSERAMARFGIEGPTVTAAWYPAPDGSLVRAWEVSVHPNLVQWFHFIVDAGTGDILNRYSRHCTIVDDPDLGPNVTWSESGTEDVHAAPRAGSFVSATALDLSGTPRDIRVYRDDNGTHYAIWDLPNTTPIGLPQVPAIGSAITLTANNSDNFDNAPFVTSATNTWTDPSSVSAHVNQKVAYDYYSATHGRLAINNRDESMISVIHITDGGQSMENAFWTGRIMGYGDGGTTFKPLAGALDVAAHEMSHGVIEHTANLIYQFQPGALNESMADVFGAFVDRDDFLMGEDIMQAGQGAALRDMENPRSTQLLEDFRQPSHMNEFRNLAADQDNGGVHINSGIPNRAAVIVMKALGHASTERIYYRALSTYLTRTSQFGDARKALEQAAIDLHGAGSVEVTAVQQAFTTVGITESTEGQGGSDDNEVEAISGSEYVFFVLEDGSVAYLDVATGHAEMVASSLDAITNGASQLSTPVGGQAVWYIHRTGVLAKLNLVEGSNEFYPDIFVQEEGDLWNVAIAPDESVAVLASIYEEDPNLYITDGSEMAVIELKAQTTQEGILDESILYPDVISFSPNMDSPKIAFDALREIVVGTDPIQFWSIYEIDVETERIYNFLATQPEGYSMGNITYGNTDPDLVAFNVIEDASNTWETWFADMGTGEMFLVPTGGVTDADRPSFAPDDSGLVMSGTTTMQLIFFDGNSGELSTVDFDQPVFNPRWFAIGLPGTAVERPEVPVEFEVRSVYPNPFTSVATVQVSVDRATPITVSVVDVLGREIERLHEGLLPPGDHAFEWRPGRIANGTYLVKVSSPGARRSRPIILAR